MNLWRKTGCLLFVAGGLMLLPEISHAQISIDIPKGVQKIGEGIKEQFIVFQDTVKGISESQLATFIGNGIDAAKKGMKFSKDLYKDIKKFKDDIEASKSVEALKLSKQIASETKKLEEIQEEKKQAVADLKADAEAEKIVLDEKISIAQSNFKTTTMLETKSTGAAEDEGEVNLKDQTEQEIEQLQDERKKIDENLDKELIQIEKEYDMKLYSQSKTVIELTKKLKKLLGKAQTEDKKKEQKEKDPLQAIKETMEELSYKETDIVTVEKRLKKEEKRTSAIVESTLKTTSAAAERIAKTNEEKENNDNNASVSGTLNGKSESTQLGITSTIAQIDALYAYLALELRTLQEETAIIISNSEYRFSEDPKAIDVCNYKRKNKKKIISDSIKEGKGSLADGKKSYEKLKDKGEDLIDKGKDAANQVQGKINEVQEGLNNENIGDLDFMN